MRLNGILTVLAEQMKGVTSKQLKAEIVEKVMDLADKLLGEVTEGSKCSYRVRAVEEVRKVKG